MHIKKYRKNKKNKLKDTTHDPGLSLAHTLASEAISSGCPVRSVSGFDWITLPSHRPPRSIRSHGET